MNEEHNAVGRFFRYRAAQLQGLVDAAREIIEHRLTKGIEAENSNASLTRPQGAHNGVNCVGSHGPAFDEEWKYPRPLERRNR